MRAALCTERTHHNLDRLKDGLDVLLPSLALKKVALYQPEQRWEDKL